MLLTTSSNSVTHPVLVIEVEDIKCRTLINNGVGSSCALSGFINKINKKLCRKEFRTIETLTNSVVRKTDTYQCEIKNANQNFKIKIELNKSDKEVLTDLPNPRYQDMNKKVSTIFASAHLKYLDQR